MLVDLGPEFANVLCLLSHLELSCVENLLRLLSFLVVQIEAEAYKLAKRHRWQGFLHVIFVC